MILVISPSFPGILGQRGGVEVHLSSLPVALSLSPTALPLGRPLAGGRETGVKEVQVPP